MTRIVLIQAAPTPWDDEGRLVGSHALPLTEPAEQEIRKLIDPIDYPVTAIYRCAANEATDQTARVAAQKFRLRSHDASGLEEVSVGLWEGLTADQVRGRFPSAYPRWEENALSVNPPEGESLVHAIERLRKALGKILRKNRNGTVLVSLRPMAMQIVAGILRLETPEQIGAHLHNRIPIETIDISDEDLHRYVD